MFTGLNSVFLLQDWLLYQGYRAKSALLVKVKVKLATVVEGDQKAPFSIATTPRCKDGCYSIPWIAPLYPWYVPYIAECLAMRYQVPFSKSLVWHRIETLPHRPMSTALLFIHKWKENNWIRTFPQGISAISNAHCLVQDLKLVCQVHFLWE